MKTEQQENVFFSNEELAQIDPQHIPVHIAVIPDGNRRWAKQRSFSVEEGHQQGCDVLLDVVEAAQKIGVKVFTFFTFSTENWLRPQEEVDALMKLLEIYLLEQKETMKRKGVCLKTIGDLNPIPEAVKLAIAEAKLATKECDKIDLVLAINYGGRDEIRRSIHRILDDYAQNKIKKEELTEDRISHYLDTAHWPDPDLFIRTSGEQRISNFLLWQLSYTEFYLPDILWPDFTPQHLIKAILSYQKRDRRLGGS